jgi:hypothetical protein
MGTRGMVFVEGGVWHTNPIVGHDGDGINVGPICSFFKLRIACKYIHHTNSCCAF